MKLKIFLLYILLTAMLPTIIHSQITISNTAEIDKIKTGTTFFAMKDPASPKVTAYVDVITKNWTLSKVACIKYTDVEKNIAPNNNFVTISANMTNSNASSTTETNFFLELWTTNGKFVYDPKKRKHFNLEDKILIASIPLFPDFTTENNPSSLYKMDYDATGHLKNWSAAILGNYIQQIVSLLNKVELRAAKTEFFNKAEMDKLQTLYIPEYVLTKFSKNSADESKKNDKKKLQKALVCLVNLSQLKNSMIKSQLLKHHFIICYLSKPIREDILLLPIHNREKLSILLFLADRVTLRQVI